MIVVGGASMYKHRTAGSRDARWPRSPLSPASSAYLRRPGPAPPGLPDRRSLGISRGGSAAPGPWVPSHMSSIARSSRGGLDVLLTAGTDMLNSFSDAASIERDLEKVGLVVAYDLFANDTTRTRGGYVLPAPSGWRTSDQGTATHLYLMEKASSPPGRPGPSSRCCGSCLTARHQGTSSPGPTLRLRDALLGTQRAASSPWRAFATMGGQCRRAERSRLSTCRTRAAATPPFRQVEFHSDRALALGLPAMPAIRPASDTLPGSSSEFPPGRVLTAFHSFTKMAGPCPCWPRRAHDEIWMHPVDASPAASPTGAASSSATSAAASKAWRG